MEARRWRVQIQGWWGAVVADETKTAGGGKMDKGLEHHGKELGLHPGILMQCRHIPYVFSLAPPLPATPCSL